MSLRCKNYIFKHIGLIKNVLITLRWLYIKLLLTCIVISFITGSRFEYDKLFYFDILMIIYILSIFIIKRKLAILKFTFDIIKILFIILMPLFILINFSNNILESLTFFSQYIFLIVILPFFLDSLIKSNQYMIFLYFLFLGLSINSFFFILKYFSFTNRLYFSEDYGPRFALGELGPNEMGHYMILILFLITILIKNRFKFMMILFVIIPYILTLSKTVWVQLSTYLIFKKTKIVLISLFIGFIILYFYGYLEIIYEKVLFIFSDFSINKKNNIIRIGMMKNAIESIPSTIIFPGYHSTQNINTSLSVHNGILSYIVNFGLISFILLVIISSFFIFKNIRYKYFRFILFFIFLDLLTLMFNPIINSRIVWLPLFIYIYTYYYKKDKYA